MEERSEEDALAPQWKPHLVIGVRGVDQWNAFGKDKRTK